MSVGGVRQPARAGGVVMADARFDVAVVGAGAVGLAAALAFARRGIPTCLVGPPPGGSDGRTAALLDGSLRLMGALGMSAELQRVSAPLRRMRIVDDTKSLFRPPPVEFRAAEIGLDAFGRNVENAELIRLLAVEADRTPHLVWHRELAAGLDGEEFDRVRLVDGRLIGAKLVVAADGRRSRLRAVAGIAVREHPYRQAALTTILRHEHDHRDTSTEFHTRSGPFTLVPLPGRRSSLVWVTMPAHAKRLAALADGDLALAVGRASKDLLGMVEIDGPRGTVPIGLLVAERLHARRLALVGEAAHALPPIGAQGLNLGLADVAALVDIVAEAREAGEDVGGPAVLARYVARRQGDIRRRSLAVDGLNRALLSDLVPVDALRGFGLGALARIGPLRRAVMRAGLMAGGGPESAPEQAERDRAAFHGENEHA